MSVPPSLIYMDLVLYSTNTNAESFLADINKLALNFICWGTRSRRSNATWEGELRSAQKPAYKHSSFGYKRPSLEASKMVIRDGKDAQSVAQPGSRGFVTHRKKLSCAQTRRNLRCILPCGRNCVSRPQTGRFQQCGIVGREGWTLAVKEEG